MINLSLLILAQSNICWERKPNVKGFNAYAVNCIEENHDFSSRGSEWGLVFSVICPYFLVFTVKLAIFLMFTVLEKNTV